MIIAFTGPMKSGKTEACKYLETKGFVKVGFKDSLVEEIKEGFPDLLFLLANKNGCTIDELFVKKPPEMRFLLQNYGTEVRRNMDGLDYWVNKWNEKIGVIGDYCTDDCRFLNEAVAVKKRGGLIVQIKRENTQTSTHQSETEMKQITPDYYVDNNGTIEDLHKNIDVLLKEIKY